MQRRSEGACVEQCPHFGGVVDAAAVMAVLSCVASRGGAWT